MGSGIMLSSTDQNIMETIFDITAGKIWKKSINNQVDLKKVEAIYESRGPSCSRP